nr:mycothiol system anti-sigma-R factor [Actinomyces bowdenii]
MSRSGGRDPQGAGAARGAVEPDCSCSEAIAHLEAFLDHECSADLTERLAQHVATCDHCSRLADAETHLRALLRSRCAEQAPPELRARVLGRLSLMRMSSSVSVTTIDGVTRTTRTTSQSWRVERD